jgi:outer membrane lipoprotein-sorting protein
MSNNNKWALGLLIGLSVPAGLLAAAENNKPAPPHLSASEIVNRNIAARGGLQAWHAVQTMAWTGKMEAGTGDSAARSTLYVSNSWSMHNGKPTPQAIARAEQAAEKAKATPQVQLPFVLDMKRPNKCRVELVFAGKTAVQVYDGTQGWKLRPYLNRNDYEPFTADETRSQAGLWDLDGPLIDYAAKGTKVENDGVEAVEGHDAYKLKVTLKSGRVEHVWIDAQSFLDVKVEGVPRRMDGRIHPVFVYQRDFRKVDGGILMPFALETTVEGYPNTHKMAIEKVTVNPKLEDTLFTKPAA